MLPEGAGDLAARRPAGLPSSSARRRAWADPGQGVVVGEGHRRAPGGGGQLGDPLRGVGPVGAGRVGVQVDHGARTLPVRGRGARCATLEGQLPGSLAWRARGAPVPRSEIGGQRADGERSLRGLRGLRTRHRGVAHLTFDGIYALQHRGQESAGMAVSDGETITVVKDMGLVTAVFDERTLSGLLRPPGHRPHPLLDARLLGLDGRPARVPPGRPGRLRPRPQREPHQHRRPGRGGRDAAGAGGHRQRRGGRAAGPGLPPRP